MHRPLAAALGQFVEHAEERRQAGAAGHQQQRTFHLAQVEGAQRRLEADLVADPATLAQVVAHGAAREQADEELQVVLRIRPVGEGVGAPAVAAGYLQARVLAGQEVQLAARGAGVEAEQRCVLGEQAQFAHHAAVRLPRRRGRGSRRSRSRRPRRSAPGSGRRAPCAAPGRRRRGCPRRRSPGCSCPPRSGPCRCRRPFAAVQRQVDAVAQGGVEEQVVVADGQEQGLPSAKLRATL